MTGSPAARFAEGLRAGRLDFQWDPVAGRAVFIPASSRPAAGRRSSSPRTSAGLGSVYSTTTVHARGEAPRNLALIDLDEGFRMMSRVEGVAPEAVAIGMRVRLAFAEGDPPVPVFEPASP